MPVASPQSNSKPSIKIPILGIIPLRPKKIWRDLKLRENPPLWAQIFKYGVCGILSTVIIFSVVLLVEYQWPTYLDETAHTKSTRQIHMTIVLACAFLPANFFAYFSNRFFVFTPGKYTASRELLIFTAISAISFAGGELGKHIMIELELSSLLATASFIVSSALVNFTARKFIIFKN